MAAPAVQTLVREAEERRVLTLDRHEVPQRWAFTRPPTTELPILKRLAGADQDPAEVEGDMLSLLPRAMRQLCSHLQVPYQFLERCPVGLQFQIVNHFIQATDGRQRLFRCVRRYEDGPLYMRAMLSERYTAFDDADVLPLVAEAFDSQQVDVELDWSKVTEDYSHFRFTFPRADMVVDEARVGDVVAGGLHVTNSEVGCRGVRVQAVVKRITCSNVFVVRGDGRREINYGGGGMSNEQTSGTRLIHVGDIGRIRDTVTRAIEDARHDIRRGIEQFKEAVGRRIERPQEELTRLASERGFTEDVLKNVLAAYEVEPEATQFGIVNAITRAARGREGEDRYQMENVAGAVLADPRYHGN